MARGMKGPGLMLSQFIGAASPYDSLPGLARWARGLGYEGLQVPVHDPRILDPFALAADPAAARALVARLDGEGMAIGELAAHRAGQLMAVHPAYDALADAFAPDSVRGDPAARRALAERTLIAAIDAAAHLGIGKVVTFTGALAWPFFYPWPPAPPGLFERAFDELAARWRPIVAHAEALGVDLLFEPHPGEDVHDGTTFARFLDRLDGAARVKLLFDPSHMLIQRIDYLGFIDAWRDRIAGFHVKDAEFVPSAQSGVYGGYADWRARPGRFRNPGDGQVDFKAIFARLAGIGYDGWATLEWECCFKSAEQGAREGAPFIRAHMIDAPARAFDAPLRRKLDDATLDRILGISK
ncbi:MAG: sugar phosphate isomerase/epimerase [Magnetospirillum sp.]|nr:sugar phosphate isomerase/epimerase [Magnetospirillum sp.]